MVNELSVNDCAFDSNGSPRVRTAAERRIASFDKGRIILHSEPAG